MYTTKRYEASLPVPEYLNSYVDAAAFLKACQVCPNYDKIWSCPTYDFDVISYWKRYQTLYLVATQILLDEEILSRTYQPEEMNKLIGEILPDEKQKLRTELMQAEKQHPGSISLAAGSCQLCREGCTKTSGQNCRQPDQMRYSIESLGGDVGMTMEKLFDCPIKWITDGRMPEYLVLVAGLLTA